MTKQTKKDETKPTLTTAAMLSTICDSADATQIVLGDAINMAIHLESIINLPAPARLDGQDLAEFKDEMRKHQTFTYAAARNLDRAVRIKKAADKQAQPGEAFTNYIKKLAEIADPLTEKKDGQPQFTPSGDYKIVPEKQAEYDKAKAALDKEYQAAIADREVQIEVYNAALEEPIDMKLHMVQQDDLPAGLTPRQLYACRHFIAE